MKLYMLFFIFAILCVIMTGVFCSIGDNKATIKTGNCYDEKNHKIIGLKCEIKENNTFHTLGIISAMLFVINVMTSIVLFMKRED